MIKKLSFVFLFLMSIHLTAQEWITPVIKGYGKISYQKEVAVQPDASLEYKLVFDLKDDRELDGVNIGLFKVARMINMLGVANVPKEKIHIIAAVHGGATFATLNNEKYQEKFEKDNPNKELLQMLKDYGVEIFVCAQATTARGYGAEDLNANAKLALSAMTVMANYQLKGYALLP